MRLNLVFGVLLPAVSAAAPCPPPLLQESSGGRKGRVTHASGLLLPWRRLQLGYALLTRHFVLGCWCK